MSNDLIIENLKKKIENSKDDFQINAKIIANSKKNSIEETDEGYKIKVMQIAQDGKANKEIIKFLSDILNIPKTKIIISRGEFSNHKTIIIKR